MAELKYIVRISHRDKGIGFVVKQALQNAQKQETSPIVQARFSSQPSSDYVEIEVTADDSPICDLITSTINSSGRMPVHEGLYKIESIELQDEGNRLRERISELQRSGSSLERQLATIREENAKLRIDTKRAEISTPLEGLLAYFEKTNYSPQGLLEDTADLNFAQRVFSRDIENTFVNYVNHVLGENLTENDIEEILNYQQNVPESTTLYMKYQEAMDELNFLKKLKDGETDIPETLRGDYVIIIEAKDHEETINKYESAERKEKEIRARQNDLHSLRQRYDSFSEQIDLLDQAGDEVPVIFNFGESCVDMYFPFKVRDVKAGFIADLREEIGAYFKSAAIKQIDHKFVAYRISESKDNEEGVDHLVEDTPVVLRIAGFNKIIQYKIEK